MKGRLKNTLIAFALCVILFIIWPWQLSLLRDPISIVIEDHKGQLLSAQIASDGQWRFPMMDSLPDLFVEAITTFEDKRFWWHPGIDPFAISRAAIDNIGAGQIVSGASTLSMQIIRLSERGRRRSLIQKIKESLYAVKLESLYSKKEILRLYAAHAPFGGNVVGLEAASWRYFNKSPFFLSPAETATLAVLPNAPSLVTLERNRHLLFDKRNSLLRKMYKRGLVSETDFRLATEEPIIDQIYALPHQAPHLLEYAKKRGDTGRINTTIKHDIQSKVNDILDEEISWLSQNEIYNAAVLVLDTRTSEVVAYGGNAINTTHESAVDMIQAYRSSGSILKPFLYAAMIEEGMITPDALIQDTPLSIDGFSPVNYNDDFSGAIAASQALSRSLNVPFVVMLQQYGVDKFISKLRQLGLSSINKSGEYYGLSLILGGAEVSLWELTAAYAYLGQSLHQFYTDKDYQNTRYTSAFYTGVPSKPIQGAFSAGVLYHTLESMREVIRPDEYGNWEQFSSSRPVAWKTGTSFGHRDAWAVGVTPDYTIGVWVGNADGQGRAQLIGSATAGKVLFNVLDVLSHKSPWYETPYDNLIKLSICKESGMLPGIHCEKKDTSWLAPTVLKSKTCPYHQKIYTDTLGQWQVFEGCGEALMSKTFLNLPPLMAQYYQKNHPEYSTLPPLHPECSMIHQDDNKMDIIYPYADEKIYLPRDFDGKQQKVIAQLVHRDPDAIVYWYLDGAYVGLSKTFHTISILKSAGVHTLLCTDSHGVQVTRRFEIINE